MESPTPKSETNLRRYKGIRASKKSLYSYTDFYLKDEEEEALGPRSVSLSALVTVSDQNRAQTTKDPGRMSQLETLEAKMASIEVSLANVAAAQAPRRMKRNGLVGTARSLHSSHIGGGSNGPSREFHKEMDFLRQGLKDKENLILNLQAQLRKLSKRKLTHGSITSTDSGVVSLRILSENERKAAEERLAQLDKDMDIKRAEIKRITHRLERLDPSDASDNIDVRIQQAELEYELEREELNLMNLQEERRNLHTILDDNDAFQKRTENSLFTSLPLNTCVVMHSFEVVYDANDASFTVGKREDRTGTYVTWTRDDMKTLKRGDRIVEVNGTMVISKGVNRIEEFWSDDDNQMDDIASEMDIGAHPLRIVVMRAPPPPPPPRAPNRELHNLKEELSLVTAKLEQVTNEKREMHTLWQKLQKEYDEMDRVRMDNEKVTKERDILRTESVRLKHRISYLEEQVTELIHQKEANGHASITVFQKGNQKTIVAEPPSANNKSSSKNSSNNRSNSPNRPPSAASSRNCDTTRQALKTRLWETFRRATSSDSRSVCSMDSNKHGTENGYFKKRSSESKAKKAVKPPPPSKPLRLSLQRATSTTNVYPNGEIELNPGLKRSNYSENTLLPDWVSDDMRTESEHHRKKRSGKHHGIRWPSLRPASSMSYAMGSRTTTVAKF